jgi:hypothetical protein
VRKRKKRRGGFSHGLL